MALRKRLVLLSLILCNLVEQPTPEVSISQGKLRGRISADGQVFEYLGIPYATANETNRFMAPYPPPRWDGVLNAVNEHHRCPQIIAKRMVGEEDCLKINIYTPFDAAPLEPLPVMVFIHGGGFVEGSGNGLLYDPVFFVQHRVIVATINYRIGALGFLCLGLKQAPGNIGLKDQVAALRWVNKNIRAFGGDPDNVTVFGESAGAASASFLRLTPLTKGLFKRVIMQSGSSLPIWAISGDPIGVASRFAEELGYYTKEPETLLQIYKNVTLKTLIETEIPRKPGGVLVSDVWFIPCIENEIKGEESIINEPPFELLSSGKYNDVPSIHGFNDNEGILFISKDNDTTLEEKNNLHNLPTDLGFESDIELDNISRKLRTIYFDDKPISKETILNLAHLYSDQYFIMPSITESELVARMSKEPQFNYVFKYSGQRNIAKSVSGFQKEKGATHADDIFYMFKTNLHPYPISKPDRCTIDRVTTMWTNFAKYGNPTPVTSKLLPVSWTASEPNNFKLLAIDEDLSMVPLKEMFRERLNFWNETYLRHRRKFHQVGNKSLDIFYFV